MLPQPSLYDGSSGAAFPLFGETDSAFLRETVPSIHTINPASAVPRADTSGRPVSVHVLIVLVGAADIALLIISGALAGLVCLALGVAGSVREQSMTIVLITYVAALTITQMRPYHVTRLHRMPYRINTIMVAVAVAVLSTAACLALMPPQAAHAGLWLLLAWAPIATGGLTIAATATARWAQTLVKEERLAKRIAVIGANEFSETFMARMAADPDHAGVCVGLYLDGTEDRDVAWRMPVLGPVEALVARSRHDRIDAVVIAAATVDVERISQLQATLRGIPMDVYLTSQALELACKTSRMDRLGSNPVIKIGSQPLTGWQSLHKRALDCVLSGVLLLMTLPVLTLIALAIRLDSPGPVLFRQPRLGLNNTLFDVLKFRSMFHHMADLKADQQTTRGDPRITRVGRFLRRTSLDEVPQLINVLRGEMSLVGPRPHAPNTKAAGQLFHDAVQDYALRHRVKPGITGWAQVNGWRGETRTQEQILQRVAHDLYYIDNWCMAFDLKIILLTITHQVGSSDAF